MYFLIEKTKQRKWLLYTVLNYQYFPVCWSVLQNIFYMQDMMLYRLNGHLH